jgi:shikimate kinase
MSLPDRIFLIGYMGSGKTTLGKLLAEKLDYQFFDMDASIEETQGKTISRIFSEAGEVGFRKLEQNCLHDTTKISNAVISTGGGVPCFFDNMSFMMQAGWCVYLNLSIDQLTERLLHSKPGKRPLLEGKTEDELRQFITTGLAGREAYYLQAHFCVSGSDEEMLQKILGHITTL